MLLGALLSAFAFFGSPNFQNLREFGAGWLLQRVRDVPLEGVVFVLEPVLAIVQLVLAGALLKNRGGRRVVAMASLVAGLMGLGVIVVLVLAAAMAGAGGAH